MHNHHDKIRERVAKLVRLARNNPSCAEAATAFALAVDLASKAGLDLDAIAIAGKSMDLGDGARHRIGGAS